MSLSPGKTAEGRWGAAALVIAQAVRAQSPAATRPEIVKAVQEQVPNAPKCRRTHQHVYGVVEGVHVVRRGLAAYTMRLRLRVQA